MEEAATRRFKIRRSLKECSNCKEVKPLTEFHKRKSSPDGLRGQCKTCKNKVSSEYREKHREELNKKHREVYYKNYKANSYDKMLEKGRKSDKKRRKQKTEYFRKWRHENPERAKAIALRNKEKHDKWIKENSHRVKELRNNWRKKEENKHKLAAASMAYEARKIKATPKWLTKEQKKEIESFYKIAKTRSDFHEVLFHVDHIEPLRGKTSCGLHVPWNLQVITASENSKKSNKLEIN